MLLRIGTRGSQLALAQTNLVVRAIGARCPGVRTEIVHIQTLGDRKQGTPQARVSDKKEWILDLEEALLGDRIDLAVHSAKDVPCDIMPGSMLLPLLERGEAQDAFVGAWVSGENRRLRLEEVPPAGIIGTASLRRKAQLMRIRPGVRIVDHRGNVPTRLAKLESSAELSGIILAAAGLRRLDVPAQEWELIDPALLMPAMNQGILAGQILAKRSDVAGVLQRLVDPRTKAVWEAERSCIAVLGADCHSSVCAYARVSATTVQLSCRVLSPDGTEIVEEDDHGAPEEAAELGARVARRVLEEGGLRLLELSRNSRHD